MSSFFTVPGAQKKRKRPSAPEAPQKRIAAPKAADRAPSKPSRPAKKRIERDESISGSDSEEIESQDGLSGSEDVVDASAGSDGERETAAEKRLRLAERYLENVRQEVDHAGFDAEEIDRDIIAERLIEDMAESHGKLYKKLASEFSFGEATHTLFRNNTNTVTSVAICAPYAYTVSRDMFLIKWKIQDLPQNQYPQTTKKKPKKPPAPPRRRPERVAWRRGDHNKVKDKAFQGHTAPILCVAASQDGKFVATGGADRRLIVHDATTLRPLKVFAHHRDAVTGLAFRRGTNQLFSCSNDRTVKVWSLDELAYVETLFGHQDCVTDVAALAQERCITVGARDRSARLWKIVDESQLVFRGASAPRHRVGNVDPRSLAREGSMDRVAMVDDELFVTGSDNGSIALWSTQKKKPLFVLPLAHGLEPPLKLEETSAEQNPDPGVIPPPQPRWITALRTIPYSDLVLSGSWDGHVRVWRLTEDKKKLEAVGILGARSEGEQGGAAGSGDEKEWSVKGIVNDISVLERGDRGKDGLCVVIALGKEHRLGRWKKIPGSKNAAVVFEIPKVVVDKPAVNGAHSEPDGEDG